MPQLTGNSNVWPRLLQDLDGLGVGHAHEGAVDDVLQRVDDALFDVLVEKRHVLGALSRTCVTDALRKFLGQVHVARRSEKAISGSIIQNSARWRAVLEFSARKVGPKV